MKILVVDPHAIYRRGLVASLALLDGVERVAQADGIEDARREDALQGTRLVVLDTSLPSAREFVAELAAGGTRVIACSSQTGPDAVIAAVEAGAVGFMRKDTLTQEMLKAAVAAAESGASVIAPDLLGAMVSRGERASEVPRVTSGERLTTRERRVLELIADGLPTREVAVRLSYSERTVKNALHDVVVKLNARSRSQAVACAVRDGLI